MVLGLFFYSSVSAKEYVCIQEAKKENKILINVKPMLGLKKSFSNIETENETKMLIKMGDSSDEPFQWAETFTRICGRDQLEQLLPHFGEGSEDELKDYLETDNFHEREAEEEKKLILRGLKGTGKYGFLMAQRKSKYVGKGLNQSAAVEYGNSELPASKETNKHPSKDDDGNNSI